MYIGNTIVWINDPHNIISKVGLVKNISGIISFINKVGYVIFGRTKNLCGFNECIWIGWVIASIDWKSSNLEVDGRYHGLGLLYTQPKNHDHEIVRAQK